MDLNQIRGNHEIDGVSRMPEATEDGKFRKWNNATGVFDYVDIADLHISDVVTVGNTVTISRTDGATWNITLPSTPDDFGLSLPGNTKVLFDNNNVIGGSDTLTYDYINDRLVLTDMKGIFAKSTLFNISPKSVLQYRGDANLFISNQDTKAVFAANVAANSNIAIGRSALASIHNQTIIGDSADNNVALGIYAGASTIYDSSVYIGAYAGRLDVDGNKLYIHNSDFNTLTEFKEGSLLYGEFDLGILHINKRLDVSEEIKIGTFDIANTPEGGMLQFVDAGGGTLKPQYYDDTQWVDFATNSNYYLTGITNVDDVYTFAMNGTSDVVKQIPDTNYPSSGTIYKVQLSNGDNTFIHDDNLTWSSDDVLTIGGAMVLPSTGLENFTATEGLTVNTGTHVYMYIDGAYRQLDNEATSGEANKGENIGGEIEVYADFNTTNKNLQFYTLRPTPTDPRITITQNTGNETIDFNLDYTVTATNAGATGQGLVKAITGSTDAVITDIAIKRLHSSNASVSITPYADYIDLQATGVGGGEVNTGLNIGGYKQVFESKSGVALQLRTLNDVQNITITQQANSLDFSVDSFVNNAANIAGGINIFKDYTETTGKRVLNLRPLSGINGINVALNGDIIEAGINVAIPSIVANATPVWVSGTRSLTWNISYDDDILTGAAPVTTPISTVILGDNLTYNAANNTLNAVGGPASTGNPLSAVNNNTIVRDVDGFVDRGLSNKQVDFILDDATVIPYPTTQDAVSGLGWLAFENEYFKANETTYGIVKLGGNVTVDGNGDLYVNIPAVETHDYVGFYPMQYALHDADNVGNEDNPPTGSPVEPINDRRDRARANIGAAYVNGASDEVFEADSLTIDSGKTVIDDNNITSTTETSINLHKDNTEIKVTATGVDITLDGRTLAGGVGDINFYMYDSGGIKKRVAKIGGRYESGRGLVADFEISGNFTYRSDNL